eukprot:TRINITY_DN38728_c0_g1_i2.p1 TRINITY_DN38728_c0_g1~~TRINITY_DN38728_c0_g1_i2.p1  ORF type:complete len:219 (+),score=5.88 TRINITY_DN38728_c0_g1_i2:30-659(+)
MSLRWLLLFAGVSDMALAENDPCVLPFAFNIENTATTSGTHSRLVASGASFEPQCAEGFRPLPEMLECYNGVFTPADTYACHCSGLNCIPSWITGLFGGIIFFCLVTVALYSCGCLWYFASRRKNSRSVGKLGQRTSRKTVAADQIPASIPGRGNAHYQDEQVLPSYGRSLASSLPAAAVMPRWAGYDRVPNPVHVQMQQYARIRPNGS